MRVSAGRCLTVSGCIVSVAVGVYGEKIHRKLSMRGGGGGASVWSPGLPLNCNVFVSAVAQLSSPAQQIISCNVSD